MVKKQKLSLIFLLLIFLIGSSFSPALSQSEVQSWIKRRLTKNAGVSRLSSMAVSGSNVHVVWQDDTPGNYEIYYRRSSDNGATWGKTKRLTKNTGGSYWPSIAVSGKDIHVIWMDDTPGNDEIFYKRSLDNGASWSKQKRLTKNVGNSGYPSIAVSGSNIHVVWEDHTPGNLELYYKRSIDNGASWSKQRRLTRNAGGSARPAVAVFGSNVHVVWADSTPGNYEAFYKRSSDNGVTWGKQKRLTSTALTSISTAIAVSGNNIHVTWWVKGTAEIYYKRSNDNGANWRKTKRLTNNVGASSSPAIDVSGGIVYVFWQDDTPGNYEIYYKRSSDSGATWAKQKRLTRNAGRSNNPDIVVSGGNVHVVWDDNTPGTEEVFYKRGP